MSRMAGLGLECQYPRRSQGNDDNPQIEQRGRLFVCPSHDHRDQRVDNRSQPEDQRHHVNWLPLKLERQNNSQRSDGSNGSGDKGQDRSSHGPVSLLAFGS